MSQLRFLWFLLLLSGLFLTGVVQAQEPVDAVSDDDVNQVARELYCPICENTPLDVCETQACEDWRQLIREKLTAGQSDQEIIEYFAEVYGDRARATPTNRVILAAPWVVAIAAGIYFALLLRRWLARGEEAGSTTVPAPTIRLTKPSEGEPEVDNYVARLEREIEESS